MTKFKSKWLRMDDRGIDGAILSDACERFCAAFVANVKTRPLLFISGVSGSGKTHASLGVARFARAAASICYESGNWPGPPTDQVSSATQWD